MYKIKEEQKENAVNAKQFSDENIKIATGKMAKKALDEITKAFWLMVFNTLILLGIAIMFFYLLFI